MISLDGVAEISSIIQKKYGNDSLIKFIDIQKSTLGGRTLDIEHLKDSEQVTELNIFWRKVLLKYPNSTFIKAWLVPCDNLQAYLISFENNWLPMLHKIGVV